MAKLELIVYRKLDKKYENDQIEEKIIMLFYFLMKLMKCFQKF
jgi:hypothetical protein